MRLMITVLLTEKIKTYIDDCDEKNDDSDDRFKRLLAVYPPDFRVSMGDGRVHGFRACL